MAFIGTTVNVEIFLGSRAFGMKFLGHVIVLHQLWSQNCSDLKWYLCPTLRLCGLLWRSPADSNQFSTLGSRLLWPQMWQPGRRCTMQKLDTALKRWFDVVIMFPTSFQLVFSIGSLDISGRADDHDEGRPLVSRSPLTLLKRVNSITRYMTFLRSKSITAPGVESGFYAFLNEQRDAGAPQSRLAAMVESVRFMEHVVGLTGVIDLLSRRCLRAAKLPTAGPQRQASPLTVGELVALHATLLDETEDVWDRNMAGAFFVLCLHPGPDGQICNTPIFCWQTLTNTCLSFWSFQ